MTVRFTLDLRGRRGCGRPEASTSGALLGRVQLLLWLRSVAGLPLSPTLSSGRLTLPNGFPPSLLPPLPSLVLLLRRANGFAPLPPLLPPLLAACEESDLCSLRLLSCLRKSPVDITALKFDDTSQWLGFGL